MDMALIVIDKKSKKINFAGAYNPMLLIRNEEMQVINADKMPVGYHFHKKDARFTDKFVEYQENDCVYIFSDGYADQFGGEKGRKFSPKRLRQTLLEIHKLPMQEQREILNQKFEDWRNSPVKKFRQLDDVLVIGFIL
jgi:serine phosphatase RsbU (regulator of sigma subunit)